MTRKQIGAVALVGILVVSIAAPMVMAAGVSEDLTFGDSADAPAPDPYVNETTLEKDHNMTWGTDTSGVLTYEDDNGDAVEAEASLNASIDNRYGIVATDIDDPDWGEFPRKSEETGDNTASALDASEWSKDTADTTQSGTLSDVETAEGVDAVRLATDGQGSSDHLVFTYDNFSVTSDESKRYLTLAMDVSTLDSGATVSINVTDEDGDHKTVTIDTDDNAANSDVVANSTGDGKVLQTQLTDLATTADGDGDFNNIQKIAVNVSGADADLEVALIDLEKKSTIDFGEKMADTDDDDELETVDHTEPRGEFKVHDLSTLDSSLDNAAIRGMDVDGVEWRASDLEDSDDYSVSFSNAEQYPSYDKKLDVYYRVSVPSAIDLSHTGLDLVAQTMWPGARYSLVETKEGVGDTDFDDIDNWNDQTSSFGAADKNVTLDSTVSSGTEYAIHMELLLTDSEANAMQSAGGSGGSGGGLFGGGGGGGILGFFTSLPGMLVTAGALVVQRVRGGFPFSMMGG
jgi:hypothetical protein